MAELAALRKHTGPGGYKIEFEALPASSFDYELSFEAGEDEGEDGEDNGFVSVDNFLGILFQLTIFVRATNLSVERFSIRILLFCFR